MKIEKHCLKYIFTNSQICLLELNDCICTVGLNFKACICSIRTDLCIFLNIMCFLYATVVAHRLWPILVVHVKSLDTNDTFLYPCFKPNMWFVLCPTGGSRGLVQGRLWRRDGVLAATCSQEGVLRVKPITEPSKLWAHSYIFLFYLFVILVPYILCICKIFNFWT